MLDPVSNMDGVLKPVTSVNPDNMPPTPLKPNAGQSIEIKQVEYNHRMFSEYFNLSGYYVLLCVFCCKVIDISHHTVLDPVCTSCWQQITNLLCSKYIALAIVIAIIAVLCVILSTHCKYTIYC